MALALTYVQREPTTLIDLDFVNPYFRSLDHRDELEEHGVHVIAPDPEIAQIDAPAFPPSAREAIISPSGHTLVDLGGDPAGAIVIGQFAPYLSVYDLWAVVNFSRPMTEDPPQAAELLRDIAEATRLQLTGLISNTHLSEYTTPADVLDGLAQTRVLGEMLHLPVVLLCVPEQITLPPQDIPILPITRRLRRPWE